MQRIISFSMVVLLCLYAIPATEIVSASKSISASEQVPQLKYQDSSKYQLTVSGWEFQVDSATMAPSYSDEYSLGYLEDGRSWLVVEITGSNTSSDKDDIHSNEIQLKHRGETIKQTGVESELVADALGILTIGGSFRTEIQAGEVFEFVQVYKVEPSATGLQLEFDFNGTWQLDIDDLIVQADTEPAADEGGNPFSVQTNKMSVELMSAVSGRSFAGPFHLGNHPNGDAWTVILLSVSSKSEEVRVSEMVYITIGDEEYFADSDVTEDVADELGIVSGTTKITSNGEGSTVVLVFSTPTNMKSSVLTIEDRGDWYIDLASVLELSDGSAEVIDPEHSMNLAKVSKQTAFVPTPLPTATMEPTAVPQFGSFNDPVHIGDTIEVEGFSVTLEKVTKTDAISGGMITPRGGAILLIAEVRVTRISTESGDVSAGDFTMWNPLTDKSYNDAYTLFAAEPFRSADLAVGEYTYGQIVFEVPENANVMALQFRPAIWSDTGYWSFGM